MPAEYFDSVRPARVAAVAGFGFTERQARFLVTVMVHSGVFLERQYCTWLGTERDKRDYFDRALDVRYFRPKDLPHVTYRGEDGETTRYFPDKLPIGIEKHGFQRHVFVYLVTRDVPVDFRSFLLRHA